MNKKLKTERLIQELDNAECEKAVSLRHGLYAFLHLYNPKVLANSFKQFILSKLRRIKGITRIAFKYYRDAKWEIFLYRLDKDFITIRAQWIRDFRGWETLNPQNLKAETLIIELLNSLGNIRVLEYLNENRIAMSNLTTLINHNFPISIPEIEEAIERNQKQKGNQNVNEV